LQLEQSNFALGFAVDCCGSLWFTLGCIKGVSMIFRSVLFLVSSIAVQAFAVANFSGHWVATNGKVSSNVGLSADCKSVEIFIEQTETSIVTKTYRADCGTLGTKWGPVRQEIRGTQIFEEGDLVGTISGDTLMTTSKSGTAAYAYNLKLIRTANGELILKSYYGTKTAIGAIATEADLHLASE
jgi:hypothetical protein